jgi:DNA-binding NarL/FixJ family response regulator
VLIAEGLRLPAAGSGNGLAHDLHSRRERAAIISKEAKNRIMTDLNEIKVTPRDQQVLDLLVQGCSNKEIAGQLNISPRTVKQHLRTLFLRAGIREGRKRVKLAIAIFSREEASHDA